MSEPITVDTQSHDSPVDVYENHSPEWKIMFVGTQRQHVSIHIAASLLRRETGRNEAFELFGIHYN
jgi:hypothetical protein